MPRYDFDIGVIGGGAAGLTVASGAAQLGAGVVLIERERELGGDCLHYGCVPSKTLISSARLFNKIKHSEAYGLPKMPREPVDFSRIRSRIRSVIARIQEHDSVERFCSLGVKTIFGSPEFSDEHTVRAGGKAITAGRWVMATGSLPAIPKIDGLASMEYLTNRELFSLDRLPSSLIVLGGGAIAVEMAQAFSRLGSDVTIVQRSGQLLSREDRDMAEAVLAALEAEGVRVMLNADILSAISVSGWGARSEVRVRLGGEEQVLVAEAVLVAMGRASNTSGLGLDKAGVALDKNGWIQVDSRMRTSQPHIFAAGDITGAHQFTHAAGYEAGIVVSNAVLRLPRKADYTWMPRCAYMEPELACMGITEAEAQKEGIEHSTVTERFSSNDRALAEGIDEGMIKLVLDRRERVIGVQIFGPSAGEIISEWVAAMAGGVGLAVLAGAVHPYPTLSEINKRVAGSVLAKKLFSPRVRKGLKFVFQLKGRVCGP